MDLYNFNGGYRDNFIFYPNRKGDFEWNFKDSGYVRFVISDLFMVKVYDRMDIKNMKYEI